jgi:hypothetical protein
MNKAWESCRPDSCFTSSILASAVFWEVSLYRHLYSIQTYRLFSRQENATLLQDLAEGNTRKHRKQNAEFSAQELQGLTNNKDRPIDDGLPTLAIVCELEGELGNHLSSFVHGFVLWLKLTRQQAQRPTDPSLAPFNYRLVVRHKEGARWSRGKWLLAQADAQKCFGTSLGSFNVSLANTPDFDDKLAQQRARGWTDMFQGVND